LNSPRILAVLAALLAVAPAAPARELRLTGELVSRKRVNVQARVSGQVEVVHGRESQFFPKGAVLAELDSRERQLDLQDATAAEAAAAARLAAMEAGGRPAERARAEAQLAGARAGLEAATKEHERIEGLASRGGATPQQLDGARERLAAGEARVVAAEQTLDLVEQGPRAEERRAARADVRRARVARERAELRLAWTMVRAPFDGVVGRRLVEPGQHVIAADSPQASVLFIHSDSRVIRAILDLPERELPWVRVGQAVEVFVQYAPERPFAGRVSNVYPFVDPATRMGKLEVEIPNDPIRLLPGMFVTATLEAAAAPATSTAEVLGAPREEPKP
jgi:multidrug resistance efflux pump